MPSRANQKSLCSRSRRGFSLPHDGFFADIGEMTPNQEKWIPSKEETFAQIGLLLLLTQDVEFVTTRLLGLVYPNGAPSAEELEKLSKETLGALIRKLKTRVELDETFQGMVEHFVEGRNIFVHRLRHQSWFDLESEKGRDEVWNFLEPYQKSLTEIYMVVNAALFKHSKKIGVPEGKYHQQLRETGFLQEIEQYDRKSEIAFRNRKK
jgi:hypothetical protein